MRTKTAILWALLGGCWGLDGGLWSAETEPSAPAPAEKSLQPRPSAAELSRAEKIMEEVFGRDIANAKSATEKGKLAKEILRAASEEIDTAVQFAALQAAQRLAVEALEAQLGLEIVQEIVSRFEPSESLTPTERLAEADRLWEQADRSQGREKLLKQLQALEHYLYIPAPSGIVQTKIERRLSELGGRAPERTKKIPTIPPRICIPDISKGAWVWSEQGNTCVLLKSLPAARSNERVFLAITADDYYEIYINRYLIGRDREWRDIEIYEITEWVSKPSELVIFARDFGGDAGVWLAIRVVRTKGAFEDFYLDSSWRTLGKPIESVDWNLLKTGPWVPPKRVHAGAWQGLRLFPNIFFFW